VAIVDKGRVVALGAISEILGATSQVRLRIEGLGSLGDTALASFGQVERQGDWFTVRGITEDTVPDLVAAVVRQGGRIFAVELAQQTLEDRFLQLLGGQRP
jgi:ABC-type uncharacterized transport system ATPase subunit